MAEEAPRCFDASSSFLGSALRSGSSANVSTPRAASTFKGEADSTMVSPLDEAAMLASAELETPLAPWPSISPESAAITGGFMRLVPFGHSAQDKLDGRRALFLPARTSSKPTSTAQIAGSSPPFNANSSKTSERADNGKRNTSVNRRRRLGLRAWCSAHWVHPYPDSDEKDELCNEYSMSRKQLDIW
jgi:Homeobox KN domain